MGVAVLIMAAMCLSAFALSDATRSEKESGMNVVLRLQGTTADNSGVAKGAISFSDTSGSGEPTSGPTDFRMLPDGRLCVLDSQVKRINVYDIEEQKLAFSINVSECGRPQCVNAIGDVFYVYDVAEKAVMAYSKNGRLLETVAAPAAVMPEDELFMPEYVAFDCALFSADLVVRDGELYLVCGKDGSHVFNDYVLKDGKFV